jgi:D-3-phosphoglycerate dehydrogenase / 2-oxoglutarate reductase
MVGALLQMLRRVPVVSTEGMLVGRELGGCTVGIIGMTPAQAAGRVAARLRRQHRGLRPRRAQPRDSLWNRWHVSPWACAS